MSNEQSVNYLQRLGGTCFAHGPYGPEGCPQWPKCATDPQVFKPVETSKPADLLDWLRERHDNAITIARQKSGDDRRGWEEDADYFGAAVAHISEVERATKEREQVLDILWRDIDDLRDPKLTVVQVAAKAANAIHWRNVAKEAAESKLSQLQLANEEKAKKIFSALYDESFEAYIPIVRFKDADAVTKKILLILNGGQS